MVNDSINRKFFQKHWINSSNLACRGGIIEILGLMHGVYSFTNTSFARRVRH